MRPSAFAAIAVLVLALCAAAAVGLVPGSTEVALRSAVMLAVAAIAVAAFAIGVAIIAHGRARRLADDLASHSRAIEGALSRLAAETQSQSAALTEASASLRGEIETLARGIAEREEESHRAAANVVAHPASRRPPGKTDDAVSNDDTQEELLREAVTAGVLELSLQPIVSASTNSAAGFETFTVLDVAPERTVHVRRLAPATRVDRAAFERLVVTRATETARRRLGQESRQMPLHCAISEALLDADAECAAVADLLALYPALARTIVLSMPTSLLVDLSPLRKEALGRLLATHVTCAAEGWDGPPAAIVGLRVANVVYLKVAASRLLDREKQRRKEASGLDIVNAAGEAGIKMIATGVETDEDAVNLLDLGVDLMIGRRFSAPKRLRPDEPSKGRVA